jgi:outer membrane protein TolC
MKKISSLYYLVLVLFMGGLFRLSAQEQVSIENYINLVKMYHPFVKQAQLRIDESKANLMKQRGAFDPQLIFDQKGKDFNGNSYYEKRKSQLSIPTLYGISIDAQRQNASGLYLDPESRIDGDQLYGLGATIELGRGLFSNPRQTALKQAKLFKEQTKEENALEINDILTTAAHAYLDWYKAYRSYQIFDQFVANAAFRFEGVKKRVIIGDLAIIDSTEARIAYNQRLLEKENALLELRKKALAASNFMWFENQPVLLSDQVEPFLEEEPFVFLFQADSLNIENHPKLRALAYKNDQLVLEKRLQTNNLLPKFSLHYQWLSESSPISELSYALDPDNNITGIKAVIPLLFRKERADLKLAKIKLSDLEWEQAQTKLALQNKLEALRVAADRLKKQEVLAKQMVEDYNRLFEGERKKFAAGESSLFLVNTRESKLIEAILKSIAVEVAQKKAAVTYYYAVTFQSMAQI